MAKIKVTTEAYVFSHNKQPKGYGLWAFAIGDDNGRWLDHNFEHTGKFSDAKKSAIAFARGHNLTFVAVQP